MSASDLDRSIIRILNKQGRTVGTGFVITRRLAVTCAHVVIPLLSLWDKATQGRHTNAESSLGH
jgi:hypothetical protein